VSCFEHVGTAVPTESKFFLLSFRFVVCICTSNHLTVHVLYLSSQDGRQVFVSNRSFNDGVKNLVHLAQSDKSDLEAVIAFEKFPESKTGKNIAEWLRQSHSKAGLKGEYIMCHSTDGASNAVASSMEFQAMTDAVKASSIRHYTCLAHQVNRSAKYASGTGDFKIPANTELAKVMKKMHEINGRVYRNETRLKVLFAVQTKKNR
jgi:hypothetical protein